MSSEILEQKLLISKAKIAGVIGEEERLYRMIPLLDECLLLLDEYGGEGVEAIIFSADLFCYLARCFERLPFYPHAIKCYEKAFKKLVRVYGEHDVELEDGELICKIYEKLVFLRNCVAIDTGATAPDVCPELSMLMVNYVGRTRCAELFSGARAEAESADRICPAGHTQSYYAELYDVELKADRKISQLDPILASAASYNKIKRELLLEKGIDWQVI